MLPSLGIVPRIDESFTEGHIEQANMDAAQPYHTVLSWLAQRTGKVEELAAGAEARKAVKQKRNFGEITSDKDFQERCVAYKKGCAIGILPAQVIQSYEAENTKAHIAILEGLDKEASAMPIFYSWVNATCHPEWLKYFDVDPFQIPTVVFYYPEKERQANLIGQFDHDTVLDH